MEKTTIIGHLGKDSSVHETNGRKAINFTVGVNRSFKQQDGTKKTTTNWYSCTRWLGATENAEVSKYLLKGTQVLVEGFLQPALYKNKENQTVIDLKLNARDIRLLSSVKKDVETTSSDASSANTNNGAPDFVPPEYNDDLPF